MDEPSTKVVVGSPKPMPASRIFSPDFAGVVKPGRKVVGPVASCRSRPNASQRYHHGRRTAGRTESWSPCGNMPNGALVPVGLVTTTVTAPRFVSRGARTLIWSFEQDSLVAVTALQKK